METLGGELFCNKKPAACFPEALIFPQLHASTLSMSADFFLSIPYLLPLFSLFGEISPAHI